MNLVAKTLAGGVFAAALMSAAPAAAQYYPGNPGYGYPGYGNPGYGGGYGYNSQTLINQCVAAVQQRLSGGYGYNQYAYGGGYGRGRVLGISRVEPRSNGGLTVRGFASSGRYAGYGYGYGGGYGGQAPADLTFKCKTDYRGYVTDVDVDRVQNNYGYERNYSPYGNDYSQYGYRRY